MAGRRVVGVAICAVAAACATAVVTGQTVATSTAPAFTPVGHIPPDQLDDAEVVRGIDGGINFLLKDFDKYVAKIKTAPVERRGDVDLLGGAGDSGTFMLMCYTLLYVGEDLQDPRLHFSTDRMRVAEDRVLRWDPSETQKMFPYDTYTTAMQALALEQLPNKPEVRKAMMHAMTRLVNGTVQEGGYSYQLNNPTRVSDGSNSQYALLGTWAAADWGVPVPGDYWKKTDDFWRAVQLPDGNWPYRTRVARGPNKPPARLSMTAAGLASLYVCDEFLNRTPQLVPRRDDALENGLAALTQGFNPNDLNVYTLYGVERVGLASGLKFLGKKNWYREATSTLLAQQHDDGSFQGYINPGGDADRVTCYALLFLTRGRAPVVMNKLQYPGPWNARPRDSANVHAYLAHQFERHLNWQIVGIDNRVADWLDAPILLITGSKAPAFTDDEVARLKQYVNDGGMIFSVADGASQEFTDAMRDYAEQICDGKYPYRRLPKDHPLFNVYGRAVNPPPLYGVNNGVRELWVHCPEDLGAIWQSRDMSKKEAWDVPARLFFYAAGTDGLRSKLQPLTVPPPATPPTRHVHISELQYDGNWDVEPGAWPRFSQVLAHDAHTDLTIDDEPIDALTQMGDRPTLAHLAGTGVIALNEAQRKSLHDYVIGGGTLFVEAMGGNQAFAASATAMLKKTFPSAKLATIPRNYLLYTGAFSPDAVKIEQVEFRKSWQLEHGRQTSPKLMFMTINGRMAVVFSAEDVSSGLLGTNNWSVGGYTPASSVALARNLVLFAAANDVQPHAAAATQSAVAGTQPSTQPSTAP